MLGEDFPHVHITTIGLENKHKEYEIEGRKVILRIWDTAGQEKFFSVAKTFYRDVDGLLLVYDISEEGMLLAHQTGPIFSFNAFS